MILHLNIDLLPPILLGIERLILLQDRFFCEKLLMPSPINEFMLQCIKLYGLKKIRNMFKKDCHPIVMHWLELLEFYGDELELEGFSDK